MQQTEKPVSVQFNDTYYPVIDGVVSAVHNYAVNMNSAVICPRQRRDYDDSTLPYKVIRIPAMNFPLADYTLALPWLDRRITEKIASQKPDILHAHSPFTAGRLALKVGKKLGIPVVATFHSKFYDDAYGATHSKLLAKIVTKYVLSFFNKADEVWTCSNATADVLRSYGYRGKISVMENGSSLKYPENSEELKARAIKEFSINPEKKNLLFVGQQTKKKNLPLIVEALAALPEEYNLISVGEGPDEKYVNGLVDRLGVRNRVTFTGAIADRELLCGIYLACDLFVFPSLYDNSPVVVREAAALNLPSVLAENSTAAEPIKDGFNGYLTKPDKESLTARITEIFASGTLEECGKKAAETIPVSWEEICGRVNKKYTEIIKNYKK